MNPVETGVIDTLDVPDGFELVDGQLRELAVGAKSSWVGGTIHATLHAYCRQHNLGWAFPQETTYRGIGKRRSVRKPDTSFIAKGRLNNDEIPDGDLQIVPDLAVETVSPNDTVYELDEKVEEYLAAGVRRVWVINPVSRLALVHRPDGTVTKVRENQELSGEDVVPGFRCLLSEILPPVPISST